MDMHPFYVLLFLMSLLKLVARVRENFLLIKRKLCTRTRTDANSRPASLRRVDSLSPTSDGPNWSMLPSDLLHMVFERLRFADFQRAKCVCPSWLTVSRTSAQNNQIPWMILFPEKGKDHCLLFNPEEKDKMYRVQDLGVSFANSHCLAICGSWLFMRDPPSNLYILNLYTRERIDLPSVESQLGMLKIERTTNDMFLINSTEEGVEFDEKDITIDLPIFWIDEETKDYVVTWIIECRIMAYAKTGDDFWKQAKPAKIYSIVDGVFKDHKLYLYNYYRDVTILDFSGDIPRQIFVTQINYETRFKRGIPRPVYPELGDVWEIKDTHFVVTVTGKFLRVKSIVKSNSDVNSDTHFVVFPRLQVGFITKQVGGGYFFGGRGNTS